MRLAWFSPWPPQQSGIAGRSAEVVPALAARGYGIDVFVDERLVPTRPASAAGPTPGLVRVQSAHDFVWRAGRDQYDLVVYQLGNSRLHQFIWPYLFQWPGLTVLHDARLHHARGRAVLSEKRAAEYRAEFRWNHPEVSEDAAELAVAGFDGAYYYLWPMVRAVGAASRLVAVHSRGGAAEVRGACPNTPVEYLTLGEGRPDPISTAERADARRALGLEPSSVVFGVFGALTLEKRVPQILGAFRGTLARQPEAQLLLAGTSDPAAGYEALAESLGIRDRTSFLGPLDDPEFDRAIAAVDVTLNLRWPTAVETSGPWLRALSSGQPTVVVDLRHQAHVPSLDPRTWRPSEHGDRRDPVTIAIDILDEDHSLAMAMHRLATDAALRARLGQAARAYWEAEHTVDRMVSEYVAAIDRAINLPAPDAARLTTIRPHPMAHTKAVLAPFGDLPCELF